MKHTFVFLIIGNFLVSCCGAVSAQTWVVGWGDNTVGQTGLPYTAKYGTNGPVHVPGGGYSNVVAVTAGSSHALALTPEATVYGWGDNEVGEAAGFATPYPYISTGKVKITDKILDDVVAISAGAGFSLALKLDGSVVSWGRGRWNNSNQLEIPYGLSNVIAIAASENCSVVLKKDGTVFGWGDRQPPTGLSNILKIAVGRGNFSPCLALKSDGSVIEWIDSDRVLPVPSEVTNVISIAAGAGHSLALKKDGTVVGWGRNRDGQATGVPTRSFPSESSGLVHLNGGVLNDIVSIAAGGDFSMALRRDGIVVVWGDNASRQTAVPTVLKHVIAITAGDDFCLAITTNSAVAENFRR